MLLLLQLPPRPPAATLVDPKPTAITDRVALAILILRPTSPTLPISSRLCQFHLFRPFLVSTNLDMYPTVPTAPLVMVSMMLRP